MDIRELHSFKLSDAVKFHDHLNPKIFHGQHVRPEVEKQLKLIAGDFLEELGVNGLDVQDITISGSNAAYSYTPHSDLDLHILVDMTKLHDDDMYRELFTAKKNAYNDSHNIKIHGIPVELYIQDSSEPVISLGEYSIKNNKWLKIPSKRRANFDQNATRKKYEKLVEVIQRALKTQKLDRVQNVIHTIKRYRQAGLDKGGEFGPENLAYKALRSQGYITALYKLRDELHSKELSIESMYAENSKFLSKPTPTIEQLVIKYKVPKRDILIQLDKGIKVELEHTKDREIAREIALDHINEDPHYYNKLAKVGLEESLNQPYKLKWEKGDHGDVDAYAKLPDGNYLSIMFNKGYSQGTKEEAWSVEFFRNNSQEVTGEGDAQRVFATVLGAIQTFIKKYKPNRIIFSASKDNWAKQQQNSESRASLYDRLVQRYAKSWGFRAFRADTGDKVIYELDRINKEVEEARSNPEQNVKPESGFKELASIAQTINDPENWAISMTSEPKLGINPQVGISEDTPKGIYFYPLNYALDRTRYRTLPWAADMPYIQLFQYDRSGEMTEQTKVDPAKLKQALSQYCPEEVIQQASEEGDYDGTPYWFIYDCLSRLGQSDETNVIRWNKVLRDLGFTSVYDPGHGWIAHNEPTQGVVLDPRIIKQHKTIINKKESRLVKPADIERAIFNTMDMELASNRIWQMYDPDGSKLRQAAKEYAKKPEFKQYFGKPGSEEIFDKAEGWGRYGARQLTDVAIQWYKAQQAQKTVSEASGSNFVYHVTPTKNLKSIAKQGLVPTVGDRASQITGEKSGIYVFPDQISAEDAVMNWLGDEFDDEPLTMLKIDITGLQNHISKGADYELIVGTTIEPKRIKKVNVQLEEASGYIPSEKEKNDPRFKTALTVDVKPDSIKKNAKAFSWLTNRAGIPPTLNPSGKI